jgi:hypothetical protein
MWVLEGILLHLFVWSGKLLALTKTSKENRSWALAVGNSTVCWEREASDLLMCGGRIHIRPGRRTTSSIVFLNTESKSSYFERNFLRS